MIRFVSLLLLTGLLGACVSYKKLSNEDRALLHLKMGLSHMSNKQHPQALEEFRRAEKLDPYNEVIQNNLGLAYFVRKRYGLAEKHIRLSLRQEPKYTEARNNLGRILIEQGAYKAAIRELKIAVNDLTYPYPEVSLANLGLAYFKNEQYQKARSNLRRSIELRPDSCANNNYYGRTLFELGIYKQASQAFDRSIGFCTKNKFDEPFYYSALSYYKLGKPEESVARLKELINKFPEGVYVDKAKGMLAIIR